MNAKSILIQRRYDLDWLRVLGILVVFIYHSTRFFNVEDWIIKGKIWYPSVEIWNGFATSWMMPLMFVISGASLFYAIGKGGFGKFAKDKILRLLVPLLVCALTHAALQAYLYNITHGLFSGNFFQFLPGYYHLDTIDWKGKHLWYLLYLFEYSMVLYPLLRWLKGAGRGLLSRLDDLLSKTGMVYALALPLVLPYVLLDGDSLLMEMSGGWPFISYMWFVLLGFILASGERLQAGIQKLRRVSLLVGLALVVGFLVVYSQIEDPEVISTQLLLAGMMRIFGGWLCVLAIFGYGMQYLNLRMPFLNYANEAVLPFYIFHQTILLVVGYFVLQWGIPDLLSWILIVAVSFLVIMGLYEIAVRRYNIMRFLFGMKPKGKAPASRPVLGTVPSQASSD